jgi:hypothetical protein
MEEPNKFDGLSRHHRAEARKEIDRLARRVANVKEDLAKAPGGEQSSMTAAAGGAKDVLNNE